MRFLDFFYAEPKGQAWLQFGELALALGALVVNRTGT
jgi:hypothetical protein